MITVVDRPMLKSRTSQKPATLWKIFLPTVPNQLGEDHQLGATLLQSIQYSRFERHKSEVANLPYESQLFYNIGTAEVKG